MRTVIDVFFFWTGNEVTLTVDNDGWQYVVKAREEQIRRIIQIVPEVQRVFDAARADWFDKNRDSTDPDLLDPMEVSGNAQATVQISEAQLAGLKEIREQFCGV